MSTIAYVGITVRGRIAIEASLAEAVDTMTFIANLPPNSAITVERNDSWYLYATQDDADADEHRLDPRRFFAKVGTREQA